MRRARRGCCVVLASLLNFPSLTLVNRGRSSSDVRRWRWRERMRGGGGGRQIEYERNPFHWRILILFVKMIDLNKFNIILAILFSSSSLHLPTALPIVLMNLNRIITGPTRTWQAVLKGNCGRLEITRS
jgi:hypothetical protein